ncbi:MAG TPA: GGDEF domain-containing protein [Rhizobium sp.]|nr:GGDEF domain-containing protein [Rhizobium sp.]
MLDINTAIFLWAMEASTLAALLAAVWLYDRTQEHYGQWALGFAAHGLGVVLIALRGSIPDILSIEIANTIALSSFLFWISGVLALAGRPLPGWAAIPMLIWIAGMLLPPIRDEIAYRIVLYNVAAASGYLLLASVAFRFDVAERRFRHVLASIWTVEALVGLIAATVSFATMPDSIQAAPLAVISTATSIFGFIAMIMIGAKISMDRSEQRLQHLIRTDPLTGALNRRGMVEGFATVTGRKAAGDRLLALALFDLDHFKTINDTHGHQAGDAVLVAFAALCRTLVPSGGIFGRTGGEEFMALIEVRDIREAAFIAETIRQAFAVNLINTDRGQVSATVSIGIATAIAAAGDLDRLMSGSDRALYKAKARGRNRCAVLIGDKVLTVPAEGPEALDEQADRQVAALKRLVAKATPQTGLSKP